ncbi:MAG: bifunctional metallophosphatase/5'-nucleotidase [Clostridiales bacterium]|nr:bifunctional metallophosphatase/5'-nucleotidase [Clostridiales bacterium]
MLRKIRVVLALVLALCMVLSFTALAADSGYTGVVTIVHTNDVHSNVDVEPYVKGYVDALRAEGKNVVLVSAGDAFKGTAFADLTDGLDVATVMNMAGYDLFAMGNHEQLLGLERFKKIVEKVEFPVLAANLSSEWREEFPEIKDYVIKEFGGTKIAFIGITYPMFGEADAIAKIITSAERAKTAAEAEGASVFIAVTHLGILDADETIRSTYLAEKCPWLTAIIDAHCHTAHEKGLMQHGVLTAETGEYGKNIGVVELTLAAGKVTGATAKLVPITDHEEESGITPDAEIQAFITGVRAKNEAYLKEVVATTPVDLDGVRGFSRTRETNFGNVVTDAMRKAAKTDIAIVMGPYLRVDVPAGDITREQLMATLYENVDLCVVEVTGADIYEFMARGLSLYPKENTWFTHVSGVMVEFNPNLGNSVISIRMPDGSDLDMDATYTCAVRADNVGTYFPNRAYTTGRGKMCEVVADYFNSGIVVSREAAGRMKPVETGFSDVTGHWAEVAIIEALKLMSITGYADGTFRPDAAMTLDGFITLLKAAFKLTAEDVAAIFPDGGSAEPIARKDAALYFMRLIDRLKITLPKSSVQPFTDLNGVSADAAAAIGALQSAQLVNGVGGGQFNPNANATRCEMATLVDRLLTSMAVEDAAA